MRATIWHLLRRTRKTDPVTLGLLVESPSELCVTAELPWRDNHPDKSCIPAAIYPLSLHEDGTRLRVHDVPGRTGIRIENFNWPTGKPLDPQPDGARGKPESEGCIGVGARYTLEHDGVTHSVVTLAKVRAAAEKALAKGPLFLVVQWESPLTNA